MFHDYLVTYEVRDCRRALIELFKVLDTPISDRDEYLEEDLAQFPYVNGGLFADETIEIPPFTEEIKELLLTKASEDFDWSDISPTIFGAVFESTLNPETIPYFICYQIIMKHISLTQNSSIFCI